MYEKGKAPFRIKVVEPIEWNTKEEREKIIKDAYYCYAYVPAHQGRAAEHAVCKALIKTPDKTVYSNAHFGTTEVHARLLGANPVNLPVDEALDTGKILMI